jgi:hypothetical protein
MIKQIQYYFYWVALLFAGCAGCNSCLSPGLVGPLPPQPPSTLCEQACEICVPDEVSDCARNCELDQQSGVASQMNPGAVVEAGVCPNP